MNFILLMFSLMTTAVIVYGSLINAFADNLPTFFIKTFRYGKFAYKGKMSKISSQLILEVPKSWFKHFYYLAILVYSYIFYLTTRTYVYNYTVPETFNHFLNILCGNERVAYTSATKTYIAVVLLTLQVFRRFYDTNFISVFGRESRMNFNHYVLGMLHYPGAALAILCEAPKFAKSLTTDANNFDASSITYMDILAILLFIWAWWHQYITSRILANLRRDKKGVVVSDDHKLPHGDWFDYLSAPHQTAEILMYFAVTLLLWHNITWFFVFAWVFCNQVETILLSHWWYQETFDKFPKERMALIPLIY